MWGASLLDIDKYYQDLNSAYKNYRQSPMRAERIQPNLWVNKKWFPFGDFNGGGTQIYWDADPTGTGNIGQIIAYQHDPDAIYYVAPDFISFLRKSNDLLQENRRQLIEGFFD
jgi:cell wall assembly regulator SMI1